MSSDDTFHRGESFLISEKLEGDPIVWTETSITALSEALISASPFEKNYFFSKSFQGRNNYLLPSYFLNPKDSFDPAERIRTTELFNIIETYNHEEENPLRDFIGKLISHNVLLKDKFYLLKCNTCKNLTIGIGDYCNSCGKRLKESVERRSIYFLPRIIKDIFYQPGRIIEGVVYHSLKSIMSDEIKIGMNVIFKEENEKAEIDVAIKNRKNDKLLVAHVTTAPKSSQECKQFKKTLERGIRTIFITTAAEKDSEKLKAINETFKNKGTIFWDITNNPASLENIKNEILNYIL
jgi:hypothetical protein